MFRLMLHHNEGQKTSCLESLVEYAILISQTAFAQSFDSLAVVQRWIALQPVKPDCGDGAQRGGCSPTQRSRQWPLDGMNCWEATAHFVGVALALRPEITVHIYDVDTPEGGRHVFPALQSTLGIGPILEVVLQPDRPRAQAWYNTVADVAHGIGSAVLGVFGLGVLVPLVEKAWQAAPEEYGLSKYQTKPEDLKPQEAKPQPTQSQDAEIRALQKRLAQLLGSGSVQSPISKTSGGGGGSAREPTSHSPRDRDTAVIEEPGELQDVDGEPRDTDMEGVDFSEGGMIVEEDGGGLDTDSGVVDFDEGESFDEGGSFEDGGGMDADTEGVDFGESGGVDE